MSALILSMRRLTATIVALVALLSVAPLPLLLAANDGETCGMACCRRTKVCCCKRARTDADRGLPKWSAAPSCAPGCRQSLAFNPVPLAPLPVSRPAALAWTDPGTMTPDHEPDARSPLRPFALRQRPPPLSPLA